MIDDPSTVKKPDRKPRPVESFGPELLAALMQGAKTEGLAFKTSFRTAIRFRLRVHQLREAMRKSNHSQYNLVARVRVSIKWPLGTALVRSGRYWMPSDKGTQVDVVLAPNDSEFGDLLRGAGVDPLAGFDDPPPSKEDNPNSEVGTDLERLLNDFKKS